MKDLTGQKFGRWTVIGFACRKERNYWNCKCECGTARAVSQSNLVTNISTSCGCKTRLHGMYGTKINKVWNSMRDRCNNPKHPYYNRYGGRGIVVCERWNEFINFYNDMHATYKEGLELDRINNDGNYEPSNCRWTTRKEQCNNKRQPKRVIGSRRWLAEQRKNKQ